MASKHLIGRPNSIELPADLLVRCQKFGEHVVANYRAGYNVNSRAVSSHGAEADVNLQACAKMSECAFCIWARLDPLQALHWDRWVDGGYDLIWGKTRIDVKSIGITDRFLIWPYRKTGFYDDKKFDVLVVVREHAPTFLIERWIEKGQFRERKLVANDDHALTAGTWFMSVSDLHEMYSLRAFVGKIGPTWDDNYFEHYCWCGKWGAFGKRVNLRQGELGQWFCFEHWNDGERIASSG
jgi:hypothetical protein